MAVATSTRPLCLLLFILGLSIPNQVISQVEYAKPWEKGTNICAYIVRDGILDHKICTYCLPWKQQFGQKMISFRYDCCPGFKRTERFGNMCVERERTWKLIPGLLNDYKLNNFSNLIVDKKMGAGFSEINNTKSPKVFTVIAPYSAKAMANLDVDYSTFKGQSVHPVLFNVVQGRHYLRDLRNGLLLKSEYRGQILKVTKYSNGIICIECRTLVEPDHEARNGIVHYFSGPLIPHESRNIKRASVMSLLENDPRTENFASSIPINLRRQLAKDVSCNWYTVFAPTKEVWEEIMQKYGELSEQIAANHILRKGMYCSAAIISRIKKLGPTFADEHLEADCSASGTRMLRSQCGQWSNVIKADLVAGNGVVHHIDRVLIPRKAYSMKDFLENNCLKGDDEWVKYLRSCDLRMNPSLKYAVLVPTMKAFKWWRNYPRFKSYYQKFRTDKKFRCRLIRYHIFQMTNEKASALRNLWLQQEGYRTNNGDKQWEVDYFMKVYYGSLLHFHYSPVVDLRSYRFEGGSIYFIDRVNMIPEKYIIDILPTRADFSIVTRLTKEVKMDANVFKKKQPLNLYLVVRNGGFSVDLQSKIKSKDVDVSKFLLLHHIPMYLWGGDIGYFENGTRHRFMSSLGVELIFDREKNGTMYIGHSGMKIEEWPKVVEWNIFAIDGNIWVLDRPLMCPGKICVQKKVQIEKEIWKVLSFACWESLRASKGAKASQLEPWLDSVPQTKCITNRDTPKKVQERHEGGGEGGGH